MKCAVVFLAMVGVVLARPDGATYTDRYDNVNLDEILSNPRLLEPYIKCILDKGKCTPDGKELKSHIREAMVTNCAKCTETQRQGTHKVIGHLINHEAESWNQLKAKYDPAGKYSTKYEEELKTVKV